MFLTTMTGRRAGGAARVTVFVALLAGLAALKPAPAAAAGEDDLARLFERVCLSGPEDFSDVPDKLRGIGFMVVEIGPYQVEAESPDSIYTVYLQTGLDQEGVGGCALSVDIATPPAAEAALRDMLDRKYGAALSVEDFGGERFYRAEVDGYDFSFAVDGGAPGAALMLEVRPAQDL